MANIRGDQVMARIVAAVALKRSGLAQKTYRASPNKDSPVDKKQKRIANR